MCRPGVSSMMRRLWAAMSCPSQLYHIYKAVNKISRSTFFVIAFFISQKVQISSVNSFHAQISRIIFWSWSPRGAQNSSYYGLYYFKIRKITKLIHTKKTTHPNVATWRGLPRRSPSNNQFKRKGKRLPSSTDLFIQNKSFVLPLFLNRQLMLTCSCRHAPLYLIRVRLLVSG